MTHARLTKPLKLEQWKIDYICEQCNKMTLHEVAGQLGLLNHQVHAILRDKKIKITVGLVHRIGVVNPAQDPNGVFNEHSHENWLI